MKVKLKEVINRDTVPELRSRADFLQEFEHYTRREAWGAVLREFLGELTCAVRGHRIESEAFITPDSGTEYFWCSRCGWSSHTHWY